MEQSHKIHDPFLNKEVEISSRLTDRLRGRYASGPTMANGEPEFGWREFETPPIQHEAAAHIERLHIAIKEACDLLAERRYGNNARSPGHNARLKLEAAVSGHSRSPQENASD